MAKANVASRSEGADKTWTPSLPRLKIVFWVFIGMAGCLQSPSSQAKDESAEKK
jgi:hypothetical protein